VPAHVLQVFSAVCGTSSGWGTGGAWIGGG
jgi:hypothetical protein